jgi:aminodeoxyfutalosine deaminase
MKKISADIVFPVSGPTVNNGIVIILNDGTIEAVIDPALFDGEVTDIEHHDGIICPGFINSHCHLELSHMKGRIKEGKGLTGFIRDLQSQRVAEEEEIQQAIASAEEAMIKEGIVAVGDISNGSHSFNQKAKGKLKYHTFFEVFGFDPDRAEAAIERAEVLQDEYIRLMTNAGVEAMSSIVPHSPYSVSAKLFKLTGSHCYDKNGLITMHNQETESENELFLTGKGKMREMLENFGLDLSHWSPTGFNSLPSVLVHLPKCNKMLLVHNTFSDEKDIRWALDYNAQTWFCLCPGANVFIEGRLPDVNLFLKYADKITLGTDSLASNHQLSILEEMKIISSKFPDVNLETFIKWATKNAADFFCFKDLGSFEKGKRPGVNLIQQVDL